MSVIKAVNCKNCGGALPYFVQSRKLVTITCQYCGSVHDIKDEFKLLDKFVNRFDVKSPLELGSSGEINGIEFTVIGEVLYSNKLYEDTTYIPSDSYWIDYQLYSKTHGFATVTYEKGHFTFLRRVRDVPAHPNHTYNDYDIYYKESNFRVLEQYDSVINQVTGELTWLAKAGDSTRVIDAINPPYLLVVERNGGETEHYLGEYIDSSTIYDSFSVDKAKRVYNQGTVASQPFSAPMLLGLSKAALPTAILSVIVLFILFFGFRGDKIYYGNFKKAEVEKGFVVKDINITDADKLVSMKLETGLQNSWTWFDIEVLRGDVSVSSFGKELSYYSGYEGGESWSEGTKSATIYFRVPEPGLYSISLKSTKNQATSVSLLLKEGVFTTRYFFYLFVLSIFSAFWYYFEKFNFESKKRDEEYDAAATYWFIFFFIVIILVLV